MKPLEQDQVERIARIVGPQSSASKALLTAQIAQENGRKVQFYQEGSLILVEEISDGGPPCEADVSWRNHTVS